MFYKIILVLFFFRNGNELKIHVLITVLLFATIYLLKFYKQENISNTWSIRKYCINLTFCNFIQTDDNGFQGGGRK